jgi:hypothetical protein
MPSFQILGEKNGNNSNINSPTTENTLVIMAHRDYVEQAQAGWQDYRRELEITDDSDTSEGVVPMQGSKGNASWPLL